MKGRFGTYGKGGGVHEVKIGTNQNFRAGRGHTYQYEHMIPVLESYENNGCKWRRGRVIQRNGGDLEGMGWN
jgi:hypothetical protein